jgi:hypothetical protein
MSRLLIPQAAVLESGPALELELELELPLAGEF